MISKYTKITLISFIIAAACWMAVIAVNPANIRLLFAVAATVFSILFVCFLAVSITRKVNKSLSPYRVFAIADSFLGLCVSAYAVYNLLTDTGWFAGITGALLLMLVVPIILVLLLADLLVYRLGKSKK